MGGAAAVGVHDDLPPGEAGVPLRTAHHETACGVYIDLGVVVHEAGGDGGTDHQVDHVLADLRQLHLGPMLGGHHHRVNAQGLVILVILHGDLGLAVGTQIVHQPLLAHLGQAAGQLVSQGDGQRHILLRLIAGVAEHHALVSGSVVQAIVLLPLLGLQALVHAHGDVGGLLVNRGEHRTGVAVKAKLGPVITDVSHHIPGDLGDVHIAAGGDLPHHMDQAGSHCGLTGHPRSRVLSQDRVQHRVGDLVADFVGMPLGDGFRCKQSFCHSTIPFSGVEAKKTPRRGGAFGFFAPSSFDPLPPDLAPCRVFLPPQVAGLHRAVPSAALDKVIQFYKGILYQVFPVCQLGFEKYSLSRNYNQEKPHEIRQKEIPAKRRGFLKGANYSSMSITTLFPRCGQSHESSAFAGTLLI